MRPTTKARHSGARVKRANPESITTIGSMDSGPAPSKSAVADLDIHICRTRVNPRSVGASRNDKGWVVLNLRRGQIFYLDAVARFDDLGDPLPMAMLVIALVAENADRP
jgi:hypothetical protein